MKRTIALFACLALLALGGCGEGVAAIEETTADTAVVTTTAAETTTASEPDDGAPSFEAALQGEYAGWREGYLAVLQARWKEHLQRSAENGYLRISYRLADYNRDGTPELLVWLWVHSDIISDMHLLTYANGRPRLFACNIRDWWFPDEYVNEKTEEVKLFAEDEYEDKFYEISLDFKKCKMEARQLQTIPGNWRSTNRIWGAEMHDDLWGDAGESMPDILPGFHIVADAFEVHPAS